MHFGIVTTSYPRFAEDSAGEFVRGLCRYLSELGHRITVVCAGDGVNYAEAQTDHFRVVRIASPLFYRGGAPDTLATGLKNEPIQTAFRVGSFSAKLLLSIYKELSACDLLISHWLIPCSFLATWVLRNRPHVAIAHSSDVYWLRRLGLTRGARRLAQTAQVVYVAPHLVMDRVPGIVVPMGIFVRDFDATPAERTEAKRQLGLSLPTALFLGRLVPIKGLFVLLAAFEKLLSWVRAELAIVGDGPLAAKLGQVAAKRKLPVRFVGPVAGKQKKLWLAGTDLLVLPSLCLPDGRTEGTPVVLWEAMAAGLPIVAARSGGIETQLGDAGLLVPPGDAQALARAMAALLLQPARAAHLRELGRQRAATADWSHIAPRLLPQHGLPQTNRQP